MIDQEPRTLVTQTAALALRRAELRQAIAKTRDPARRDRYEREMASVVIAHCAWRERLRARLEG